MVVETMVGTAEYLKAHDLDTEALRVKVAALEASPSAG